MAGRCVAAIDDLPAGIDVAVLAVPGRPSRGDRRLRPARVGGGVVFAAGFAEVGAPGRAEQETMAHARARRPAAHGPNCLGFVNFTDGVPLTYEPMAPLEAEPAAGDRRRGAERRHGVEPARRAAGKGAGVSGVVSTGNEAVLGAEDFLGYLIDDEATRAIVAVRRADPRPRLFLALAGAARAQRKPIVMMHPGRSVRAQASARTHTGATRRRPCGDAALVAHEA